MSASGPDEGLGDIAIWNFHALVKNLTRTDVVRKLGESNEDFDERVGDLLKGKLADGSVRIGIYDAILIDEGQDFTTLWMQGLTKLLNAETDSPSLLL